MQDLNGYILAGRAIRVGLGNDKFTPETTAKCLKEFQDHDQAQPYTGSSFSGSGGRGSYAGGKANFERKGGRDDKGFSALDDSDVGGVNFHAVNRESLMKKLARGEPNAIVEVKKPVVLQNKPTRCVVVKNAYDEAEYVEHLLCPDPEMANVRSRETEANWDKELEEDFREECSAKYGPVVFVGVYRDNGEGEIYVKFKELQGGDKALKGLNGRYFGGRTLTAQPMVDAIFNMNFPKAANL